MFQVFELVKVTNDPVIVSHNRLVSMLVLLELTAAFDTADYRILLPRLEHDTGIRGTALNWLRPCLSDR